jgi:hypothetical protein
MMGRVLKSWIKLIPIGAGTLTGFFLCELKAEPIDPAREEACIKQLQSLSLAVDKYTGKRIQKFGWQSIYKLMGNQAMQRLSQYGNHYGMRFNIVQLDAQGVRGDSREYWCITDAKTKKFIGFEEVFKR